MRGRRALAILVAVGGLLFGALGITSTAADAMTPSAQRYFDRINDERASVGAPPLPRGPRAHGAGPGLGRPDGLDPESGASPGHHAGLQHAVVAGGRQHGSGCGHRGQLESVDEQRDPQRQHPQRRLHAGRHRRRDPRPTAPSTSISGSSRRSPRRAAVVAPAGAVGPVADLHPPDPSSRTRFPSILRRSRCSPRSSLR